MKNKAGVIFPVLILIFGAYALLTALGVTLSSAAANDRLECRAAASKAPSALREGSL